MLSLCYKLEDSVEILNQEYKVNLSFDNILKLIDMLNDEEISNEFKVTLGIRMLLNVSFLLPINKQSEILNELISKYVLKQEQETTEYDIKGNPMPKRYKKDKESNYSLKHDAEYIFASFYQAYQMDLIEQQGALHWDKFNALLAGLPSGTKFKEVLDIRQWKPYKGCSKEEKKNMKELQKIYALPKEGKGEGE